MYGFILLVGYLGSEPQLRYLPSGTAVCDFRMATSRKYTRKDGNVVEETTWYSVSAWGKDAENAHKYLSKGRAVLVRGRLKPDPQTGNPRVFEKRDGTYGASYEVSASDIKYLPGGAKQAVENAGQLEYSQDVIKDAISQGRDSDEEAEFIY